MAKYIDKEKLIERFEKLQSETEALLEKLFFCGVLAILDNTEEENVAPIVCGKNKTQINPVDEFICSECGATFEDFGRVVIDSDGDKLYYEFEIKFCPNCGAKIEENE